MHNSTGRPNLKDKDPCWPGTYIATNRFGITWWPSMKGHGKEQTVGSSGGSSRQIVQA